MSSSRDGGLFGEDFGQKVDLTASIRNILRNYPEGTAVLKELVQNADDAGARTISFCLDCRQHGTSSLADASLSAMQGPSLLAYNDSIFTDEDFKSIQRIGDSLKKTAESKAKIGRFGIGFNAVYHWTDLPSFVSSKYLVMLDPQAKFLPHVNPSNPGKIVDWVSNPGMLSQFGDQFTPYRNYEGLDFSGAFRGTIFRLPLRTVEQAKTSMLSKRALSIADAKALFTALRNEASAMLLFLKNIQSIEIKVWEEGAAQPSSAFSCGISNMTRELYAKRSFVSSTSPGEKDKDSSESKKQAVTGTGGSMAADYSLNINCVARNVLEGDNSKGRDSTSQVEYEEHWEVCNTLGGPEADAIASDPANELLRLIPWAGVASFVSATAVSDSEGARQAGDSGCEITKFLGNSAARESLAYCFLPLPVRTNLPVMVNGFFELSSNRRDIWQAGSDMTGDGRTRAMWNIALMRDIIARSYVRLLLRLKNRLGYCDRFQQLWPSIEVSSPWSYVVDETLRLCQREELLYVNPAISLSDLRDNAIATEEADTIQNSGGFGWVGSLLSNISAIAGIASNPLTPKWIAVREAILLPVKGFAALEIEQEGLLAQFLLASRQPFVSCIPKLRKTLAESKTCKNLATPALTRRVLKSRYEGYLNLSWSPPTFIPSSQLCSFLLFYTLSDMKPENIGAIGPEIDILEVLPLRSDESNGVLRMFTPKQVQAIDEIRNMGFSLQQSVGTLSRNKFNVMESCEILMSGGDGHGGVSSEGVPKYIQNLSNIFVLCNEEECDVFGGAGSRLVDKSKVGPKEIQFLSHVTMQKYSNVRLFNSSLVPDLIAQIIPTVCMRSPCVERAAMPAEHVEKYISFLRSFWKFAGRSGDIIKAVANGAALVPCVGQARFLTLAPLSNLIVAQKGDTVLPDDILDILRSVGANVVDSPAVIDIGAIAPVFWDYVRGPSRAGILQTLDSLFRSLNVENSSRSSRSTSGIVDPFSRLRVEQRDALRVYLASCEPVRSLTKAEVAIIQRLPIFCSYPSKSLSSSGDTKTHFALVGDHVRTRSAGRAPYLRGAQWATVGDNARISEALYPPHFIKYLAPQDLHLLEVCEVKVLRRSEYFKHEFLPNTSHLYQAHRKDTENDLLLVLTELSSLSKEDSDFVNALKTIAFVPCQLKPTSPTSTDIDGDLHDAPHEVNVDGGVEEKGDESVPAVLYKPSDLFDPHDAELRSLLDTQYFPAEAFCRDDIVIFLRSLGLQTTLNWPGVIACANSIAKIEDDYGALETKTRIKVQRGNYLLRFLEKNISRLMDENKANNFSLFSFRSLFGEEKLDETLPVEHYIGQLVTTPWLPVATSSFHLCMPLPNAALRGTTAAPADSRPMSDAWLCSASKRLVSENVGNIALQKVLGWTTPLDVQTIAVQLKELAKRYHEIVSASAAKNSGRTYGTEAALNQGTETASLETDLRRARETVTGLIPQLYQKLNDAAAHESNAASLLRLLETSPWVWVGETFVTLDHVALKSSVNAAPYLYQLPQGLQVYSLLLSIFRVKETFSPRDFIYVLRIMAEETGAPGHLSVTATKAKPASASASAATANSPTPVAVKAVVLPTSPKSVKYTALSDTNIDLAVSLVTLLASEGSINPHVQTIYAPDNSGRMCVSTDLVNDDVPWLSGPEYAGVRSGSRLIHPNISSHVAEKMGVKSLRSFLVTSTSNQSLFTVPEASVEAFGQSESITNRLRTILDLYPDGNPIFSELIQNADDAGASTVRIMLDENTYNAESLLDAKMAPLQGPSLIVGNDATFTEADFRSLARIGQGSKIEKLATTGRFGLGFSSTYHLTDTPTFVSGEHLVVFDPHCAFVPGANRNQPGLRIRFQGNSVKNMFKDQFDPYCYFGCDFENAYEGTLFRFPLRNTALARRSEISKRSYTIQDVRANLDQLIGALPHHLLFLRSVRHIEVYHCAAGQRVPQLLHRAHASMTGGGSSNDQTLLKFFEKDSSGAQPARDDFYRKLLATPDGSLPLLTYNMCIRTDSYDPISAECSQKNDAVCTHGALLSKETVSFLVMSGLRGGEAKRMACDAGMRHLKLVPFGSVAACIARETEGPSGGSNMGPVQASFPSIDGQTFCFLPLPVKTKLPVHTNAYWELSSNRRDIWRGDDMKGEAKLRSEWNKRVMTDVLAPLYAKLLIRIAELYLHADGALQVTDLYKINVEDARKGLLSLLPCPLPAEPWNAVGMALLPLLRDQRLLYSNLNGGMYLPLSVTYLMASESSSSKGKEPGGLADGLSGPLQSSRLEALLLKEKLPISTVPANVLRTLVDSRCVADEVTPALIRSHFSSSYGLLGAKAFKKGDVIHPSITASDTLTAEEMTSNAVFLLQYCFEDINRNNYSQLDGLHLLPLENGQLGMIGSPIDPPLFIASDTERKLLGRAGSQIVASETCLGAAVSACLRDSQFSEACNVRPLTSLDILRLLKDFIPGSWFAANTLVVDRQGVVSNEWLVGLWNYVLESDTLHSLFADMFPMLPIMQPAHIEQGQYLAKICTEVPVLHMAYHDIPADAAGALAAMDIYVFDPSVLGNVSYSKEVIDLLYPPTPRGVLDAFESVGIESIKEVTASFSPKAAHGLRTFLLDSVLVKIDKLREKDGELLRSMKIWECHSQPPDTFCDISETIRLAPRVEEKLLGKDYLKIRTERDRTLYHMIGVPKEVSRGEFYAQYIIPRIASKDIPDEDVDAVAVTVLRNLPQLKAEHDGLTTLLEGSKLFRNAGGELRCPKELYDPQAPAMTSLLPASLFPSQKLMESGLLLSLRSLGINSTITCAGVLAAAESIESSVNKATASTLPPRDAEGSLESTPANSVTASLQEVSAAALSVASDRAKELIKYLELHAETLLAEADPEGLAELSKTDVAPAAVGGSWGQELRSLRWIPCYVTPSPRMSFVSGIPWPGSVHKLPFAAPSQCVDGKSAWLCSASQRVASVEVKTLTVSALLGWNKPLSGRIVALQLVSMNDTFEATRLSQSAEAFSQMNILTESYYQVIPKIYDSLSDAYMRESPAEINLWSGLLKDKPFFWVGGRFVEASRVAFSAPANVNTAPSLYVVQGDMLKYAELLKFLGVRQSFAATDLSLMLRDIHTGHSNRPLPASLLDVSVGLLKLIVRMLLDEEESAGKSTGESDVLQSGAVASDSATTKKQPVSPTRSIASSRRTHDSDDDDDYDDDVTSGEEQKRPAVAIGIPTATAHPLNMPAVDTNMINVDVSNEKSGAAEPDAPRLTLADLGDIYAPDRDGCLQLITSLTYDDAPWISAGLMRRRGGPVYFRFLHSDVVAADAKVLGAKSLREQLFAGDEIVCPDPNFLKQFVQRDGLKEVLADAIGLADHLGAKSFHAIYDERCHPTESLMHPGLAETQGPSVFLVFDGPRLGGESIAQLFASPQLLPALPDDSLARHDNYEYSIYPKGGKRLASSFALTDCLQIISGREFYIFDPTGRFIFSAEDVQQGETGVNDTQNARKVPQKASRKARAKAQRCVVNEQKSGDDQDILSRFPDQFASFLSLPFGLKESLTNAGSYRGVILRLPLRKKPSHLSVNVVSAEDVKPCLRFCKPLMESALVLGRCLMSGSVGHWDSAASEMSREFEIFLTTNPALRLDRWKLLNEKGWERSGFTSLFGKQYVPPELIFKVALSMKYTELAKNQDGSIETYGWLNWSASEYERIANPGESGNYSSQGTNLNPMTSEEWVVMSTIGAGRSREEATREPFKSVKLRPIITVASRILTGNSLRRLHEAPDVGRYFCGAGSLVASGLPFHVEAPFLYDIGDRSLQLIKPKGSNSNGVINTFFLRRSGCQLSLTLNDMVTWNSALLTTVFEVLVPKLLFEQRALLPLTDDRGFYKYWPFTSRMTLETQGVAVGSRLQNNMATLPLFLSRGGFGSLESAIMPIYNTPPHVMMYIQDVMPVGHMPVQVTKDLLAGQIKPSCLTPSVVREFFRHEAAKQQLALRDRLDLQLPILNFVTSDLNCRPEDGEFQKRKVYRELGGVPAMPMADGSVRLFPKSLRERVFLAPYIIHALLPSFRNRFVNKVLIEKISLTGDPLFLDTLFLSKCSSQFVEEVASALFPELWKRCEAVAGWTKDRDTGMAGRGVRATGSDSVGITADNAELLLYALWRDCLFDENIVALDVLREWPVVPVISRGRRLLISPTYLPHVLCSEPSAQEISHCSNLSKEYGRLSSIMEAEAERKAKSDSVVSAMDEWKWVNVRLSSNGQPIVSAREIAVPGAAAASTSQPVTGAVGSPGAQAEEDVQMPALRDVDLASVQSGTNDDDGDTNTGGLGSLSGPLRVAVMQLGIPQIDGNVLEGPPRATTRLNAHGNAVSMGRKLLDCMYTLIDNNVIVHEYTSSGEMVGSAPLLAFDELSVDDRREILLEIHRDHRTMELGSQELGRLRALRLFTRQDTQTAVSISECNGGVYWCAQESVLQGISLSEGDSHTTPSPVGDSQAVILLNDSRLRDVYTLIGAEELTAATAVRKFTLPRLARALPEERTSMMISLSQRWGNYRDDASLVQSLREVRFVPTWNSDPNSEAFNTVDEDETQSPHSHRRACDLFSWTNEDLLTVFHGSSQSRYFSPPQLRTPEMFAMMSDLGMTFEMSKEKFLLVVNHIVELVRKDTGDGAYKQLAAERGRRLLRYAREDVRSTAIFDMDLARKISKLPFVPVQVPVSVEPGGHVHYEPSVSSFSEVAAKSCGPLVFTVMPLLDEDIAPPQIYFSSLGILTGPALEVVLKHLRMITSTEVLDRWNHPNITPKKTFGAIFQYLHDHWRALSPNVKAALRTSPLVPVGHYLVTPNRLFFRLAEDLSPFMHEVPRYYGANEQFLKNVGVKESPTPIDYAHFLKDLARECAESPLNPNELRAVIAIVQSLSGQDVGLESFEKALHLPDEDSILQPVSVCLINDDSWLRGRAGSGVARAGYFFVHPLVGTSVSAALHVPAVSEVIREHLHGEVEVAEEVPEAAAAKVRLQNALQNKEFAQSVAALLVDSSSRAASDLLSGMDCGVEAVVVKLSILEIKFVHELPTFLSLEDRRAHNAAPIMLSLDDGHASKTLSFISEKQSAGGKFSLYINYGAIAPPITVEIAVAMGLCRYVGLSPSLAATLGYLLEASHCGDSRDLLFNLRVGSDTVTLRERQRGMPGEKVAASDIPLLELKPFRMFRVGETVVFKGSKPATSPTKKPLERAVMKAVDEVEASTAGRDSDSPSIDPTSDLRYGRVTAIGDAEEAGMRRITVKTGSDGTNATLLSTEVFSFMSAREARAQRTSQHSIGKSVARFLGASAGGGAGGGLAELARNAAGGNSGKPLELAEAGGGGANGPPTAETSEPISKEEILRAISGLLARAGVPAHLDTQEMLTRIMDLNGNVKRLENELQQERQQLMEAKESVAKATADTQCQICLINQVNVCLVPCGHTICEGCERQMHSNKCPFCRRGIQQRTKFFSPGGDSGGDEATL